MRHIRLSAVSFEREQCRAFWVQFAGVNPDLDHSLVVCRSQPGPILGKRDRGSGRRMRTTMLGDLAAGFGVENADHTG